MRRVIVSAPFFLTASAESDTLARKEIGFLTSLLL